MPEKRVKLPMPIGRIEKHGMTVTLNEMRVHIAACQEAMAEPGRYDFCVGDIAFDLTDVQLIHKTGGEFRVVLVDTLNSSHFTDADAVEFFRALADRIEREL